MKEKISKNIKRLENRIAYLKEEVESMKICLNKQLKKPYSRADLIADAAIKLQDKVKEVKMLFWRFIKIILDRLLLINYN